MKGGDLSDLIEKVKEVAAKDQRGGAPD